MSKDHVTKDPVSIDTGDIVKHGPTGETWTVAYVQNGRLAWVGWPEGEAAAADCALVQAASDARRVEVLKMMADSTGDGPRQRYARWRLGIREQT